jgi:hypothetical protein
MMIQSHISLSHNFPILCIGMRQFQQRETKNVIPSFKTSNAHQKFLLNIKRLNNGASFGIENAIN